MNLAFFVYLAGLVPSLQAFFIGLVFLCFVYGLSIAIVGQKNPMKAVCLGVLFGFIAAMIPSQQTMYMMAGGYAAQKVYESPTTERISGKILTVIEKKLDEQVENITKENK